MRCCLIVFFSLLLFEINAQQVRVIDNKGTLQDVTSNVVTTSATVPTNPVEGDVWFDTTTNISKIYDGSVWKVIDLDRVTSSSTAPTTPVEGDIWFDTSNTSTLTKIFDGTNWLQIQHISDDQKIDVFEILNDSLQLSIEDDLEANKSIALADITREPWFGDDDDAAATTNTEDIYHMGRVGIGINDPGVYNLFVQGSIGINWKGGNHEMEFSTPAGHTGIILNRNSLGSRSRFEMLNVSNATVGNRYFELSYNGENALFLRKGGNVGIATSAPTEKLDVNGTGQFRNGKQAATYTGDQIRFGYNGGVNYSQAIRTRHQSNWDLDNAIDFYTWDQGTDAVGASPTLHGMTISAGRVGIGGLTSPTKALDVDGEARIRTLNAGVVGTDEIVVADTDGVLKKVPATNLNNDWKLLGNSGTTASTNFLGTTDAQDLVFKTNNIEAARFKSGDQRLLFANPGDFAIPGVSSSAVLGIDGTTHSRLRITAGDDESYNDSKGASIDLHGNNATANTGVLDLVAGSAASGTNAAIKFWTNTDGSTQQTSAVLTGTGNFGIGANITPSERLDVDGRARVRTLDAGAATDEIVVADNTGVLKKRTLTDVVQEPWFGTDDNAGATLNTENIYHMGNVGVGINPTAKLHIGSALGSVPAIGLVRVGSNLNYSGQTNNILLSVAPGVVNVDAPGVVGGRFKIDKDGNVGIGITSPISKLHVYENTASVNNTAGLTIEQDGTGDAITQYLLTGMQRWVTGVDNSDADKFKWSTSADLNTNALMTLTTGGNLGIGTTTPTYRLDINGSFRNNGSGLFTVMNGADGNMTGTNKRGIFMWNDTDSNWGIYMARSGAGRALDGGSAVAGVGFNQHAIRFRVNNAGTQGFIFENAADVNLLSIRGSDGFTYVRGNIRIDGLGAGNVQSDANGNLSVSSDERLKNITGKFKRGLDAIVGLNPISYKWNKISEMEMENTYTGFSAQNVQANIPEAVSTDDRGYLTLTDRPIIGALVNSVKELNQKNESLAQENEDLKSKLDDLLLRIEQLERK